MHHSSPNVRKQAPHVRLKVSSSHERPPAPPSSANLVESLPRSLPTPARGNPGLFDLSANAPYAPILTIRGWILCEILALVQSIVLFPCEIQGLHALCSPQAPRRQKRVLNTIDPVTQRVFSPVRSYPKTLHVSFPTQSLFAVHFPRVLSLRGHLMDFK